MRSHPPTLLEVTLKTIVVHTITYFAIGALAFVIFDYATVFSSPDVAVLMRPTSDPMVMAGPLFQPIRGLVFGLAFHPLRTLFLDRRYGWLLLWWILIALAIISPFGPVWGSIEGLVYTRTPILQQLLGLRETLLQSLLLALGVVYWLNHPQKRWLTWSFAVAFVLVLLLPTLGLLVTSRSV